MLGDIEFNKNTKIKKDVQLIDIEKGYSGSLATIGKIVCFEWNLNDLSIIEDDIKAVIPVENPTESVSFIEGYQRAKEMIKHGFDLEQYQEFWSRLTPRIKPKMQQILDIAYSRKNEQTRKK